MQGRCARRQRGYGGLSAGVSGDPGRLMGPRDPRPVVCGQVVFSWNTTGKSATKSTSTSNALQMEEPVVNLPGEVNRPRGKLCKLGMRRAHVSAVP
jgi:hypothetical protein